jgi:hypothetical protein
VDTTTTMEKINYLPVGFFTLSEIIGGFRVSFQVAKICLL